MTNAIVRIRICLVAAALGGACNGASTVSNPPSEVAALMTRDQIIEVAREDAKTKYRDLSVYDIEATQDGGNWHVVFVLKGDLDGGGPEYVIDAQGKILSKKYYQ